MKVIELKQPDYKEPAKALRNLADSIEKGVFGNVTSCGVVLLSDRLSVFGSGVDSKEADIALLFSAASLRFSADLESYGND